MAEPRGCKECIHRYLNYADIGCDINPHGYKTPQQRAIVWWLSQNPDAFANPFYECPSFEDYRNANKTAR